MPDSSDDRTLRHQMVDALRDRGLVRTPLVEAALRGVPRHLFLPGVPLEQAYADDAIVTRRDADGIPTSSASQPAIVALMLEQLELDRGQRVLEIGAGTGYNAALLAHAVGPGGSVTTVDLDDDVVEGARGRLREVGRGANEPPAAVAVECGDGGLGFAAHAPYDRIIVTVGAWDVPPAWAAQIADGGLLVVPLGLNGPQRSICFGRSGPRWRSRTVIGCGFMPMRGDFAGPGRQLPMGDDATLWIDDGREADAGALRGRLDQPVTEFGTGVVAAAGHARGALSLWLALTERRFCGVYGLPGVFAGTGMVDDDQLAVTIRYDGDGAASTDGAETSTDGAETFEVGVRGYGPDSRPLAERLADAVRAWDAAGQPSTEGLRVEAHPAGTPDEVIVGGHVVDKRYSRLGISWIDPPADVTG